MSTALLHRILAYAYANLSYRNTDLLENRHSAQIALDMEFYSAMKAEVLRLFDTMHRILTDNMAGKKPETEEEVMILQYASLEIHSYQKWDPPKKVRDRFNGDVAEFVLCGRFKQACENREVPTDALMKELNVDVNDGFFTLLSRGII